MPHDQPGRLDTCRKCNQPVRVAWVDSVLRHVHLNATPVANDALPLDAIAWHYRTTFRGGYLTTRVTQQPPDRPTWQGHACYFGRVHDEREARRMTTPDPFANESRPSLSFKDAPVGAAVTCTVDKAPTLVQSRDYLTGNPATWPDGNAKMAAVVGVKVGDTEYSVWAAKPSAMFAAIAEAQKTAGQQIAVGGTLVITYTGDKPNDDPKLNAQKLYAVTYTPPAVFNEPSASSDNTAQQATPAAGTPWSPSPTSGDEPPF